VNKASWANNQKGNCANPDDPEAMRCLTGYLNIDGVPAYVLFDSGSTTD
jgi:hypothetical protein